MTLANAHSKSYAALSVVVLLAVATAFVAGMSLTTSPCYTDGYMNSDSAMFQIIGKAWAEGHLPYADVWDSKGPFIFWINALGYRLTGSALGIFLLQLLNMWAVALIAWRWMTRVYGPKTGLGVALTGVLALGWNYDMGNTIAEYTLVPILLSCRCVWQWCCGADRGRWRHPARYAVAYGVAVALSLLSRLTNCVGVCIAVACIMVALAYHRLWRNLWVNVAAGLAGFGVAILPFVAYFLGKGLLAEMWYAAVEYNFDYYTTSVETTDSFTAVEYVYHYFYPLLLTAVALWLLVRRPMVRCQAVVWLLVGAGSFAYLCTTYGFFHYGIICCPYVLVLLALLPQTIVHGKARRWVLCLAAAVATGITVMRVTTFARLENESKQLYTRTVQHLPKAAYRQTMFYNCNPDMYLRLGIMPMYPYFTLQDWAVKNSATLRLRVAKAFDTGKAQYIVLDGDPSKTLIGSTLSRCYEVVYMDAEHQVWLFKRRLPPLAPVLRCGTQP